MNIIIPLQRILYLLIFVILIPNVSYAASISGVVSDNVNGNIEGASFNLYKKNINNKFERYFIYGIFTDDNGKYTIPNLEQGEYKLASGTSYEHPIGYYPNAQDIEYSLSIVLSENQDIDGIDINLNRRGEIKGSIKDLAGNPLRALIFLYYFENNEWKNRQYSQGYIDNFSIILNSDIKYKLLFEDIFSNFYEFNGDSLTFDAASEIQIPLNQVEVQNVVLGNISAKGIISGKVTDTNNNPLIGHPIVAQSDLGLSKFVITDSNGLYKVTNLIPGNFNLRTGRIYSESGYIEEFYNNIPYEYATQVNLDLVDKVSVTPNTVTNIDFQLDKASRIFGKLTNSVGQLIRADITLYRKNTDQWEIYREWFNSSGNYEFSSLEEGLYKIKYDSSSYGYEYLDDQPNFESAFEISLKINEEKEFDVVLGNIKKKSFSGKVVGENNEPLSVFIGAAKKDINGNWQGVTSVIETDDDGSFSFDYLEAGTYRFNLFIPFHSNVFKLYEKGEPLIIEDNTFSNVDDILIKLKKKPVISGIVRDVYGNPFSGIAVSGFILENGTWKPINTGTGTDVNGFYSLEGLVPGVYRIAYSDFSIEAT